MSTVITETDARDYVSANIRDILRVKGWSTNELVRRSGVPHNTVHRVVRGDNLPNLVHFTNIADALGVSTERLLTNPKKFQKTA